MNSTKNTQKVSKPAHSVKATEPSVLRPEHGLVFKKRKKKKKDILSESQV